MSTFRDNNLSLNPMTPENENAVYAFLNKTEVARWISSGYAGPKHGGSSLRPLNDFMGSCLLAFVIIDHSRDQTGHTVRKRCDGLVGFLPLTDPKARDATIFTYLEDVYYSPRENSRSADSDILVNFLVDYAFSELGMHRVSASVIEANTHALDLFHRLGFVEEGIKRKSHWADGGWLNVYNFGVIEEEWKKLKDAKGGDGKA